MKNLALSLAAVALLPAAAAAQTDLGPLNLPASSTTLPMSINFEGGVVEPYMAVTALDSATLLADPEAWCNVGQLGACLDPFNGSFNLEMGMIPGSTNYHNVRNALVISIDPTGYTDAMTMSCAAIDGGEETATVDGIWVSNDGTNWYAVSSAWGTLIGGLNVWESLDPMALDGTAVDTSIPFYLAFCQEDNFPYLDLDGVGIDDISIPGVNPPPVFSATGLVGGAYTTVQVESLYPGATTTFIASITGAGPELFMGVEVNLSSPIAVLANRANDVNGFAIFSQIVPASLVGTTVYMQAVVADASGTYASTSASDTVL